VMQERTAWLALRRQIVACVLRVRPARTLELLALLGS
jgi:hypothetical protein